MILFWEALQKNQATKVIFYYIASQIKHAVGPLYFGMSSLCKRGGSLNPYTSIYSPDYTALIQFHCSAEQGCQTDVCAMRGAYPIVSMSVVCSIWKQPLDVSFPVHVL
jgi:hypothetical protein